MRILKGQSKKGNRDCLLPSGLAGDITYAAGLKALCCCSEWIVGYTEVIFLLKMVASNCRFDGASLYPAYSKPFDVIFQRAQSKEWRARRDSNSRPNAPEAFALSS